MNGSLARGVYAITPDGLKTETLLHRCEQVLRAGVSCLQYRDKHADATLALEHAIALRALCVAFNTPLIINDDVELAKAVQAHGVHLGGDDGSIAQARGWLEPDCSIGVSCYSDIERARQAKSEGARYVAFGAMYPSATKPNAPVASIDVLHDASELGLPVVAIGGITPQNGRALVTAGADLLAAIGGIFQSDDIPQAVKAYQSCFQQETP